MSVPHRILLDVAKERALQDQKWGIQRHELPFWAAILGEEYGEVCKEICEITFGNKNHDDYRKELVQVAAVAVAMIEDLDCKREIPVSSGGLLEPMFQEESPIQNNKQEKEQ